MTARTGRTHTKLFQEERERPVLVLVDARGAMRRRTRGCFKSVLAARAAALLAWVGIAGGDRVGGLVLAPSGIAAFKPERSQAPHPRLRPAGGRRHGGAGGSGRAAPVRCAPVPAGHGPPGDAGLSRQRFFDFDVAAVREAEHLLQGEVKALFVFDALETALPAAGIFPVSDGTAVARLEVERQKARADYAAPPAQRRGRVEGVCRERGMAFVALDTAVDPAEILHPGRLTGRSGARPPA